MACKVVAPLLQGLRALHSQRIIHRSVLLHSDTVDGPGTCAAAHLGVVAHPCCICASCSLRSPCITAQVRPAASLVGHVPSVLPQVQCTTQRLSLMGCLALVTPPTGVFASYGMVPAIRTPCNACALPNLFREAAWVWHH